MQLVWNHYAPSSLSTKQNNTNNSSVQMLCMSLFGGLVECCKGASGEILSSGELGSETVIGIVLSRALSAELSGKTIGRE